MDINMNININEQSLPEGLDDLFNNNEFLATCTRNLFQRGRLSYFTFLGALSGHGHDHAFMRLESLSRRFEITDMDLQEALQRYDERLLQQDQFYRHRLSM